MDDFFIDSDGLIRRRAVVSSGVADDHLLRTAVHDGAIDRIYCGVYVPPPGPLATHAERELHYRQKVLAATGKGEGSKAVSHQSAAALHGIPLLDADLGEIHFTANRRSGGRRRDRACVLHAATWESDETVDVAGMLVTSLARTAVDVARSGTFAQALAVFDATLRKGVDPEELTEIVMRSSRRNGASTARRALAVADGRSESVGESLSRALMLGFSDVPLPDLQRAYFTPAGEKIGRVDFDWVGTLVGEFDGKKKYTANGDAADAVWLEKVREDQLRDLGLIVIRWIWDDLRHPERFRAILIRGLRRAGLL